MTELRELLSGAAARPTAGFSAAALVTRVRRRRRHRRVGFAAMSATVMLTIAGVALAAGGAERESFPVVDQPDTTTTPPVDATTAPTTIAGDGFGLVESEPLSGVTPTPAPGAAAPKAPAATVPLGRIWSAEPLTGLRDSASVAVSGANLAPGVYGAAQCWGPRTTYGLTPEFFLDRCGPPLGPFEVTASGRLELSIEVEATFLPFNGGGLVDCVFVTAACFVGVGRVDQFTYDATVDELATFDLVFAVSAMPGAEAIEVEPTVNLEDGQTVKVTGSGWTGPTVIAMCGDSFCTELQTIFPDAAGFFQTLVSVMNPMIWPFESDVPEWAQDCIQRPSCEIVAYPSGIETAGYGGWYDSPGRANRVALAFASTEPDPTPTASTTTSPDTGLVPTTVTPTTASPTDG